MVQLIERLYDEEWCGALKARNGAIQVRQDQEPG